MRRIHIVGLGPRTGTTLLVESMAACFRIDRSERHERSIVRHRWIKGLYLTKEPGDLPIVAPRLHIDSRLHLIVMVRDPRDVIVSRHAVDPSRYWAPLSMWRRHARVLERIMHHPRVTVVRYERLVREPDQVQDELMARHPFLEKTACFSAFETSAAPSPRADRALGGLRPIDANSVGAWRAHLPRIAGQIARHGPLVDDLIAFGYETDAAWMDELKDVEPDLAPSFWPEERRSSTLRLARLRYQDAAKIAAYRCLGLRRI